jgi:hypothetical protein
MILEAIGLKKQMIAAETEFNEQTKLGTTRLEVKNATGAGAKTKSLGAQMFAETQGVKLEASKGGFSSYELETSVANFEALIKKETELTATSNKLAKIQADLGLEMKKADVASKNFANSSKNSSKPLKAA